jgi:hypothetical protein
VSADRSEAGSSPELADVGLEPGQEVRFRRRDNERWHPGVVVRREKDGSVGLRDKRGAARSIPVDLIEVKAVGPRGGSGWEPLADHADQGLQLRLGIDQPARGRRRRS